MHKNASVVLDFGKSSANVSSTNGVHSFGNGIPTHTSMSNIHLHPSMYGMPHSGGYNSNYNGDNFLEVVINTLLKFHLNRKVVEAKVGLMEVLVGFFLTLLQK